MNKNILYLIGGLVVIGGIAGAAFFMNSKPSDTTSMEEAQDSNMQVAKESEEPVNANQTISSSFIELIKLGKEYHCTFETTDDAGNVTSGEVYVAEQGNKVNGDFTIDLADSEAYDAHVIRDGEYNYIWSSLQEQGFKTKIDPELESIFSDTEVESAEEAEEDFGLDEDMKVDFDCQPWVIDNGKFAPPSDVEFIDFSAQIETMEAEFTNQVEVDCSVCDQLPAGQAQDQCLQAMGC